MAQNCWVTALIQSRTCWASSSAESKAGCCLRSGGWRSWLYWKLATFIAQPWRLSLSAYQGVWTPNCLEFRGFAYFCRTLGFCLHQRATGVVEEESIHPKGTSQGDLWVSTVREKAGMSQEELLRDREFTEWQDALVHHNSKQRNCQTTGSPWLLVHPECTHQRFWKSACLLWLLIAICKNGFL